MSAANRPNLGSVLIVDDVPENLSFLSDALDEAGYMVLVATSGQSTLERLRHFLPDVILLDAVMPGIDGFETCRRIKAQPQTRSIPIIFMTGLTESENVVRGFEVGGTDYVTKPIKPDEVVARVATHIRNARLIRQTQNAIEAIGLAMVILNRDLQPEWMTPGAEALLGHDWLVTGLPDELRVWLAATHPGPAIDESAGICDFDFNDETLRARLLGQRADSQLLLLEKLHARAPAETALASYRLTQREIEVLMWVARGKTNKDIADILGMSPRTVNKHLEHIYVKLGVETRTAAAAFVNIDA